MAVAAGNDANPKSGPPVLGPGTRKLRNGAPHRAGQRGFVASHSALTSNIVPTVGAPDSPVLPHWNWPAERTGFSACRPGTGNTPVPRPVWRQCGNWLQAASPRPAMLPRGRSWPPPVRPRLPARLLYRIQPLLAPNALYRRLAGWLERSPAR